MNRSRNKRRLSVGSCSALVFVAAGALSQPLPAAVTGLRSVPPAVWHNITTAGIDSPDDAIGKGIVRVIDKQATTQGGVFAIQIMGDILDPGHRWCSPGFSETVKFSWTFVPDASVIMVGGPHLKVNFNIERSSSGQKCTLLDNNPNMTVQGAGFTQKPTYGQNYYWDPSRCPATCTHYPNPVEIWKAAPDDRPKQVFQIAMHASNELVDSALGLDMRAQYFYDPFSGTPPVTGSGSGAGGGSPAGPKLPNGNSIDWCLHWGVQCGKPAADEYCRNTGHSAGSTSFTTAPMRPTWVQGDNRVCDQANCVGFTSIQCAGSPGGGTGGGGATSGGGTSGGPGSGSGATGGGGASSGSGTSGGSGSGSGSTAGGGGVSSGNGPPGGTTPPPPVLGGGDAGGPGTSTQPSGMTLQAEKRTVKSGEKVVVPVWLKNAADVANMNFNVSYTDSIIRAEGDATQGSLDAGSIFAANPHQPGLVRVGFAQTAGMSGSGTVVLVPFRAIGQPGTQSPLHLEVTTVNNPGGAKLTVARVDGWVRIVDKNGLVPGHCDGHEDIKPIDAMCALKMSVQLIPVQSQMDMDGDGQVTSRDAVIILKIAMGLISAR